MSQHKQFWNREYQSGEHLALSSKPSEDLAKFARFLVRQSGKEFLNPLTNVLDLGTGNGRNLFYLAREFGVRGTGYDISDEAISQARHVAKNFPLTFEVRSIAGVLPLEDNSVSIVLDMMTSHFLKEDERKKLLAEIVRVLRPGGWFFLKTFLADEDRHAARLLRKNPAEEKGAYIHPKLGVYEYVWSEEALREFFEPYFELVKLEKSHKHIMYGKAFKRRTQSVYFRKR